MLGFGVAQGLLSRAADFSATQETALETYYNVEITPWVHLSPHVQVILNPGGDKNVDTAVVVGVRAQIEF